MGIVFGLLLMVWGGVLMYFSYPIVENIWRNARAEEHLWGTRNMILLIGFWLVVVGGLFMFGVVETSAPKEEILKSAGIE